MKKCVWVLFTVMIAVLLTGCGQDVPKELSDEYVTIKDYTGIEIAKVDVKETTDDDIQTVINHMMDSYTENNGLPEGAEITDEIAKQLSDAGSQTVDEYKSELRGQIEKAKTDAARSEEETRVWEKVMDHSEVKRYPEDRLAEIKQDLVDLYEQYAIQASVTYDEYMEASGLTDEDLDEAAKASLKQELVAAVIADEFKLNPSDDEMDQAAQDYADQYKFTSVDLLYEAISRDDIRRMVIEDNVKSWLTDRCQYVTTDTTQDTPEDPSLSGAEQDTSVLPQDEAEQVEDQMSSSAASQDTISSAPSETDIQQ